MGVIRNLKDRDLLNKDLLNSDLLNKNLLNIDFITNKERLDLYKKIFTPDNILIVMSWIILISFIFFT